MNLSTDKINDVLIDLFKEIGNIGAGNAATSLSKILGKKIDMDVPVVKFVDFKDAADEIGGAGNKVVGIYIDYIGDAEGTILYTMDIKSANMLLNTIIGYEMDNGTHPDEMQTSALKEIANILTGAYLTALSSLINIKMHLTVPLLAIDMAGAIFSVPLIKLGKFSEYAFFVETELIEGDNSIKGKFFMLPNIDSFKEILKSMGVA